MFRLGALVFALSVFGAPSQAEEAKPVEAVWSMFSTHCAKYLEANTPQEVVAAFKPYRLELGTTTDGALQAGSAVVENVANSKNTFISLQVFTTRIEGGVLRNCAMHVTGDSDEFDQFSTFVQNRAGELLGDEYNVKGGLVFGGKGLDGAALHISTPGFPPAKSISVIQSGQFRSVSIFSNNAD